MDDAIFENKEIAGIKVNCEHLGDLNEWGGGPSEKSQTALGT